MTTSQPLKKTYIIGNGIDSEYTILHNIGKRDIFVIMRENFGSYQKVEFYCVYPDENSIVINTGDPIAIDSYVIVLLG